MLVTGGGGGEMLLGVPKIGMALVSNKLKLV